MQQRTAFVLSLVLALVLSMTAFAAPLEHEGSLEFYWDKGSQLTHSEWAKLKYDLRKDFGYGFSAGLSISMSPSDTGGQFTHEWDGWANMDFGHTFVSLSSWQEFTGANFLMADGNKLKGGPGAIVDFKQLDNVAIQAHIGNYWNSEKEWVDGEEGEEGYWIQGMTYTYGAKATYDAGDYQVGLGVQGWWPEHEDLLMGGFLFGSTTLADGLTLEAEAAYRTDLEDWRYVPDWNYWYVGEYHTGKAFTAQASYAKDTLNATLLAAYKDPFFLMKSWDDPQTARDHYFMKEWSGVLLALDVEEEVIPYLTLNGSVDVLLGVEDPRDDSNTAKDYDITTYGFSGKASYRASLGSTVSAWYNQYLSKVVGVGYDTWDWSLEAEYDLTNKLITLGAEYTFVDGFTAGATIEKPIEGDFWYGAHLKIEL